MGVYRRTNKQGVPHGPWIIQYPIGVNPQTGKVRYTSEKVGISEGSKINGYKMMWDLLTGGGTWWGGEKDRNNKEMEIFWQKILKKSVKGCLRIRFAKTCG